MAGSAQKRGLLMTAGALATVAASSDSQVQPSQDGARHTQCWTSYATRPVAHVQTRSAVTTLEIHYQTNAPEISRAQVAAAVTDALHKIEDKTPSINRPPHRGYRRRRRDTGPQYPAAVFCSNELVVIHETPTTPRSFKGAAAAGDEDSDDEGGDEGDDNGIESDVDYDGDDGDGDGGEVDITINSNKPYTNDCKKDDKKDDNNCGCCGRGNGDGSHANGYSPDLSGTDVAEAAVDNSNSDNEGALDESDSRIDASHGKVGRQKIIINRIHDSFNNSFNKVCKYFVNYVVNNYVVNNYGKGDEAELGGGEEDEYDG